MALHILYDVSRDWTRLPDAHAEAAALDAFRRARGGGALLVPDVTRHTCRVAVAHIGGSLDGFSARHPDFPRTLTQEATDAVVVAGLENAREPVTVAIRVADCGAVVLSRADRSLAVVHAGWRGVAGGILDAAVDSLVDACGPGEIVAEISPMAMAGYDFGREDFETLVAPGLANAGLDAATYLHADADGRGVLDLHRAILDLLARRGITAAPAAGDTLDPSSDWPSHRLAARGLIGKTGRMLAAATWIPADLPILEQLK